MPLVLKSDQPLIQRKGLLATLLGVLLHARIEAVHLLHRRHSHLQIVPILHLHAQELAQQIGGRDEPIQSIGCDRADGRLLLFEPLRAVKDLRRAGRRSTRGRG